MTMRICLGIRLLLRHVPSALNQADGPSRGYPVGAAPETLRKAGFGQHPFGQG